MFNILSISENTIINLERDTPVTLFNNNDKFIIEYEIKEIFIKKTTNKSTNIKTTYKNNNINTKTTNNNIKTKTTNNNIYYFCINYNGVIRYFKMEKKFKFQKNSIVLYKGKKYVTNHKNDVNNQKIFKFNLPTPTLYYNLVEEPNKTYCICVKNLNLLKNSGIPSLLQLVTCNPSKGKKLLYDCITSESFKKSSNMSFKYINIKENSFLYNIVKIQRKKEDKLWENILQHSNKHCLFAVNKKEFKEFLDGKNKTENLFISSTLAQFFGNKTEILLSNCDLKEVMDDITFIADKNNNKQSTNVKENIILKNINEQHIKDKEENITKKSTRQSKTDKTNLSQHIIKNKNINKQPNKKDDMFIKQTIIKNKNKNVAKKHKTTDKNKNDLSQPVITKQYLNNSGHPMQKVDDEFNQSITDKEIYKSNLLNLDCNNITKLEILNNFKTKYEKYYYKKIYSHPNLVKEEQEKPRYKFYILVCKINQIINNLEDNPRNTLNTEKDNYNKEKDTIKILNNIESKANKNDSRKISNRIYNDLNEKEDYSFIKYLDSEENKEADD